MNLLTDKIGLEPRLWLERLVIFRNLDPGATIRDITFHRGLNVVWGVAQEAEDESESPGALTGHSVGKTTLCRLIRYALGEPTFGRKSAEKSIRQAFTQGAVGVTLHLDGVQWSVVRSIGISNDSRAAENLSIEHLIAAPAKEHPYAHFEACLDKAFIAPLPSRLPSNSDREYFWAHLLSWLTRDQESRYQNLWEWRSGRSDSGVSAFKNRKEDALFLMRMVMGLVEKEESTLAAQLDTWRKKLKEQEDRKVALQREPEYQVRYQEQVLQTLLGPDCKLTDEKNSLFGMSTQVSIYLNKLETETESLKSKRHSLNVRLAGLRAFIRQHEQILERIEAELAITREGTEDKDEVKKDLHKLEENIENDCIYGQVAFKKCNFFTSNLKLLRGEWIDLQQARQDKRAGQVSDKREEVLREWLEKQTKLQKKLQPARDTIDALEKMYAEIERQLVDLSSQAARLNYHAEQWQDGRDFLEGRKNNTELESVQRDIDKLRKDIREGEKEIEQLQDCQHRRAVALRTLYDEVLKKVLSTNYSGDLLLPPRHDLEFRIREAAAGLAGEAVETLSLVLADFTALLWSIKDSGYHPGFLLHDSPREADLDRYIYNRFLKSIHEIGDALGGTTAPFQYIITTTSKPPKAILESENVRLRLQAHPESELLFKQFLNSRPLPGKLNVQ
jgi:predicted  nucleic acid-binding Zn-ribbon protein